MKSYGHCQQKNRIVEQILEVRSDPKLTLNAHNKMWYAYIKQC